MSTHAQPELPFDAPPPRPSYDPSARKAHGDPNSAAAHERVVSTKHLMWERIYKQIKLCAEVGLTLKELKIWDPTPRPPESPNGRFKPENELSGRLSEMHMGIAGKQFVIWKSGRRRKGCAVYVADRKWCNGSAQ